MHVPWNRSGFRWYLIVVGLIANKATLNSVMWGAVLLAAGIAIHLWAKGCLHQEKEVTKSGPYRFVRHPFYLGNAALDSAVAVMSGSEILMLFLPVWWMAVYLPVMRREEKDMTELFGEAYKNYAASVPLLFPTARHLAPQAGFSWGNPNIYGVELPRVLRFCSYPFLFLFFSEIASGSFISSLHPTPMLMVSLSMIVVFNGLSFFAKYKYRSRSLPGQNILKDAN